MLATDILTLEHRIIEQVLDCLEKLKDRCREQGELDTERARQMVSFFRTFADQCHHRKEEDQLFPLMEVRGFPRESGPTRVMLHEHQLGRSYVKGMEEAIDAAEKNDKEAISGFVRNAERYLEMLREHIRKEDHCLFPMANQAFTEKEQKKLLESFDKVEKEEIKEGVHESFLKLADELADHYGVPRRSDCSRELSQVSCPHHSKNCPSH